MGFELELGWAFWWFGLSEAGPQRNWEPSGGASLVTSPHPAWKMGSATLEKWCWRGRLSAESCASYMDTFLWCVQFHGWIPMASSSGKLMGLWAHPRWYFWHVVEWPMAMASFETSNFKIIIKKKKEERKKIKK